MDSPEESEHPSNEGEPQYIIVRNAMTIKNTPWGDVAFSATYDLTKIPAEMRSLIEQYRMLPPACVLYTALWRAPEPSVPRKAPLWARIATFLEAHWPWTKNAS